MRTTRVLHAVDSHTEGMPTRVITGGVGVIPGATMARRRTGSSSAMTRRPSRSISGITCTRRATEYGSLRMASFSNGKASRFTSG